MQNVKELGYIMTVTGVLLMINGLVMIMEAIHDMPLLQGELN